MVKEPQVPLDDTGRMQAIDRRGMIRLINELPEQYETALGICRGFDASPCEVPPNAVYITGFGSAGLAADMAAVALASESQVPVISDRGMRLPRFVNEASLVLIVDYGGNRPLQIRNLREARNRGARVICVTGGGTLLEEAVKEDIPVLKIPPGQPSRTAIGYLFAPLLAILEKLGLVHGQEEQLRHAINHMKNVREMLRFENPTERNLAKRTAEALFGRTVAIYGASGYRVLVAERWKRQMAASSKMGAMTAIFPGLATDEISAWEKKIGCGDDCAVVMLRDREDKGSLADLIDATIEALQGVHVLQREMQGATVVEKLLYGFYLGDYVSYYLALLAEVDPGRTNLTDQISEKLIVPEPPPVVEAEEPSETPEASAE